MSQESVLTFLPTFGPLRTSELAKCLPLGQSSFNYAIGRLVDSGEVRKIQDDTHRWRCVWVAI